MENKAIAHSEQQSTIKDAAAKADILKSIGKDVAGSADSLFLVTKSLLISNDLLTLTTDYQNKSLRIMQNIGALTNTCVSLLRTISKSDKDKSGKDPMKSIDMIMSDANMKALASAKNAAVSKQADIRALSMSQSMSNRLKDNREASNHDATAKDTTPELLKALDGVTAAVKEGAKSTTKTITKTSKENIITQKKISKTALVANKKAEQDKKRDILTGNDAASKKAVKNKKDKAEVKKKNGKGGFDMKLFMSGFTGLLRTLFNPVAIIMSLITEFLPYIILAIAFLQGFWEGIGEELRTKITDFTMTYILPVVIFAGSVFAIIKLSSLLLITAKVSWFIAKKVAWLAFHAMKIAWWLIKKAAWLAFMAVKMAFEVIKLVASVTAAYMIPLIIIGAVLLLIGIIVLVWKGYIGKVVEMFKSIVEFVKNIFNSVKDGVMKVISFVKDIFTNIKDTAFNMVKNVVNFVKDIFNKFVEPLRSIIDGISGVVKKVVQKLFGSIFNSNNDAQAESAQAQQQQVLSTNNSFTDSIKGIIEPLHMLKNALSGIYEKNSTIATSINKIADNVEALSTRAVSNSSAEAKKTEQNITLNADKIIAAINKPAPKFDHIEELLDKTGKKLDSVIDVLTKIYNKKPETKQQNFGFSPMID